MNISSPPAPPYLSAFVICGDSGVSTLGRAIKSVLFRSKGGSMVDELIIGWNGTDADAFRKALEHGCGTAVPLVSIHDNKHAWVERGVRMKIVAFDWPGRFDTARNLTMQHCTGEWVMWFDSDDIVNDAGLPEGLAALEAVERSYNAPPPSGTGGNTSLKEWLKTLPFNVNCVMAPYDYAILQDGSVTIRQLMKRVLRRGAAWVWRSFSGVHELPYPASSIGESSIFTSGLLNRHFPPVEAIDRLHRNAEIVARMEHPDIQKFADSRHYYDVASVHIGSADFASAEKSISKAIELARAPEDQYRYLIIRYSLVGSTGRVKEALRDALAAISIFPDRGEAYFAASEGYYLQAQYRACIKYYELGATCPVNPVALDLCINRVVRPRANAAWSYCELGEPTRGLPLATEALREYPNDALAQRVYNRCVDDTMRYKALEGLRAAGEFFYARNELPAVDKLFETIRACVTLRGVDRDVKLFALEQQTKRKWQAIGTPAVTTVHDTTVTTYPAGHPPVDAFSVAQPKTQVCSLDRKEDGAVVATLRRTDKPRIAFVCHGNGLGWNPTDPEIRGAGGSETSFIFLARELSNRGYPVTLYCNDGGHTPQVHKGVTWLGLTAFDDSQDNGIVISCRTPWTVRSPTLVSPVYCWHQDNGYANEWSWSRSIEEKLRGNLHVSRWAMQGLMNELGGTVGPEILRRQHVIGNPIAEEWVLARRPSGEWPKRNAKRVVYASDPMRGLGTLVNCWPIIREAVPDAELHAYCGFELATTLLGLGSVNEVPVAREGIEALEHKLRTTPGITWHSKVGQPELTEAMLRANVYAYPGCNMPEGFGVVFAQAAAAGMIVVAPNEGALPEILDGAVLVDPLRNDDDVRRFAAVLVDQLQNPADEERRFRISADAWELHAVTKVADRFEAVLRKDGLVP